ncbi:MAG: GNAT family N-acetyltransferase [Paracoccaceae bacterium]
MISPGFSEAERPAIAALYWEAFGPKLRRALGSRPLGLIAAAADPAHALVARECGRIVGVAGIHTAAGAFVAPTRRQMRTAYPVTHAVRTRALDTLSRDEPSDAFVVDGLSVTRAARGRGIGTALMGALIERARTGGHRAVTLDVAASNGRARALYARLGFAEAERRPLGWRRAIFATGALVRMERQLQAGSGALPPALHASPGIFAPM